MSIVYLAINEKANRSWAVKELIRTDPRAAGISKKETDLLKKLHHPGIAGIVDVIEQKESQLIVMDYVEGHSLDQVLEEQGVCSEREVMDIGIQLCEVLEYLHTRKPPVIYRDLKPSNVMKKPDGKLVEQPGNTEDTATAIRFCWEPEGMLHRNSMKVRDRQMQERIFTVLESCCLNW